MILTEFRKLPFYNQLAHRRAGFELCLLHMDRQPPGSLILETGTLRIPGNYYGDGNSSAIWEWLLERRPFEAVSVDIDENAVEAARRELRKVQVVHSDSLAYLSSLTPEKLSHCRLLYLDSFDWSPEIELVRPGLQVRRRNDEEEGEVTGSERKMQKAIKENTTWGAQIASVFGDFVDVRRAGKAQVERKIFLKEFGAKIRLIVESDNYEDEDED